MTAQAMGVPFETKAWEGDTDGALSLVLSLNLKRRQLTASQLAMVALEIEKYEATLAQKRMTSDVNQHSSPKALMPQAGNGQARVIHREGAGSSRFKLRSSDGAVMGRRRWPESSWTSPVQRSSTNAVALWETGTTDQRSIHAPSKAMRTIAAESVRMTWAFLPDLAPTMRLLRKKPALGRLLHVRQPIDLVSIFGRTWQARTADQRIKSPLLYQLS